MKKLNILVSAAGSPLGQSIYKALSCSDLPLKIFFSDIHPLAAGFFLNEENKNIVLPTVSDKKYDQELKYFIESNKINCIFPVLEIEHQYFDRESEWFKKRNVQIVTLPFHLLNRCYDKYECMNFLKNKNITVPDTIIAEDGSVLKDYLKIHTFPLFLKPRNGASSTNTFLIKNENQLRAIISTQNEKYFILQTYIAQLPEYTVGVYRSRDGSFERTCIIERELKFGLSYRGTVIDNSDISKYALTVVRALDLHYSANVQLRIENNIPYAFEINPRLSSTTSVRAHFGFNEPEMIILELFDTIQNYKQIQSFGSFARAWTEYYDTRHHI